MRAVVSLIVQASMNLRFQNIWGPLVAAVLIRCDSSTFQEATIAAKNGCWSYIPSKALRSFSSACIILSPPTYHSIKWYDIYMELSFLPDRIAKQIRLRKGCWIWTGGKSNTYG